MKRSPDSSPRETARPSAVVIGTFDGVHRGHQKLIATLNDVARRRKLRPIIVTLHHPVRPVPGLLTTIDEKLRLLARFPVDDIVVLPVGPHLIAQTAMEFFDRFLLDTLNARHLVVGTNFTFGHNRRGNVIWLREHAPKRDVKVTVVSPLMFRGEPVSSSRIRKLLTESKVEEANRMLGHMYWFEGKPFRERGVARTLGTPTVNLKVAREKLLPHGVFAALSGDERLLWPSVLNIGTRPTFFKNGEVVPETNLLGFKGKWGDKKMTVYLYRFIRKEKKFTSKEGLAEQIHTDIQTAIGDFGLDSDDR